MKDKEKGGACTKNKPMVRAFGYCVAFHVLTLALFFLCFSSRPLGAQLALFNALAACVVVTVFMTRDAYAEKHGQNAAVRLIAITAVFLMAQTGLSICAVRVADHSYNIAVMEAVLFMLYRGACERNSKATPESEL